MANKLYLFVCILVNVYVIINRIHFNKENKMSSKLNEKTRKQIYSVILVFLLFTLICLFTNLISAFKQFLIGSFGLVIYPMLFLSIAVCILKLMNKTFALDAKSLLYCVLIFVAFLGILQMALTRNFDFSSYLSYVQSVYFSSLTPGGVIIGTLIFPFNYFLHEIATYIVFSIALIILIACAVDNYYLKMAKLMRGESSKQQNSSQLAVDEVKRVLKENCEQRDLSSIKMLEDNEKEANDEINENDIQVQKDKSEIARELLGLKTKESKKINSSSDAHNILYGDETTRKKAISTLYPNKATSFGTIGSEEYLQDSLEKYMPLDLKKSRHTLNVEDNASASSRSIAKMESDKISSIEYLNRTIPKAAQKGTIIRGDYYKSNINSNEQIEVIGNEEYDNNLFNFSNKENSFMQEFDSFEPSNEQEAELNEILANSHTFSPDEVIDDSLNLNEQDIFGINNLYADDGIAEKQFDNKDILQEETSIIQVPEINQPAQKKPKRKKKYVKPPISLLTVESTDMSDIQADTIEKSSVLEKTLSSFKIPAKVNQVIVGPSITMYEMTMPTGISVKSISRYSDDVAMSLASKGDIRIQAPIPGKNAVGIEVPNERSAVVGFREVFENGEFDKYNSKPLAFVLGKDIYGKYQFCDLAKAPHILIAGSTGSGKSVCLNILILSLIFKNSPEDVKLVLVDPKRVEFAIYEGLPHLMLPSIITEPEKAVNAFSWAVNEMENRYRILQQLKIRDIGEYNNLEEVKNGIRDKMSYIVIIVDELADLMSVAKRDLEDKIQRIAAKARSAGIHLVLATQRPSIDVVTGTIKNNLPARIAFSLASFSDSKTVIDQSGAEKLLGKGDMLYSSNGAEPKRFQSSLVTTEEIKNIVEFIKENNESSYQENIETIMLENQTNQMEQASKPVVTHKNVAETDECFLPALKIVVETRQASASLLQRRLRLGWNRAGSLIDAMQKMNYISAPENNKRQVLITMEQLTEIYGEIEDL